MSTPSFDREAIRSHFDLLHGLAASSEADGILILAGYGENPTTGQKAPVRVERFRIGDVDGMTDATLAWQHIPHLNAYAPWSVFRRSLDRGLKGGEKDVVAVLGLVADLDHDTGKAGELPLPAPYSIETSAGNLQPVYPLARALDPASAKEIGVALVDAVRCDARTKDMSGVWRIPGTLNWPNKVKLDRGRPLAPQLVKVASAWDGSLVLPEELRAALDARPQRARSRQGPNDGDGTGGSRSLAELLRRCGAGLRKLLASPPMPNEDRSEVAFSVLCQLVARKMSDAEIVALIEAHPDGIGQRYADGKDIRADVRRAREKTGQAEPGETPIIRVIAGELPRVVDEAERALLTAGLPIFSRAGALVRPITDSVPAAHGRTTTVAKFKEIVPDSAVDLLSRVARFERFDMRSEEWVTIDPPAKVASVLLAREGEWRVPAVTGIITTPTLRPDGSILSAPGYDQATRLFMAPDHSFTLPPLVQKPTREQALAALELLKSVLVGFPFVSGVDRAVALSGILTAVARGGMSVAPLHAIRAHTAGTGKSYLVDIVSTIATGRPCPVIAAGKTEEETEKRLGSLLKDAAPIVSLDNVNGELGGDALCQMTERPLVRIRILGKSETPEFECKATVFATGNNLTLVGDMTRRTILCSLDAGVERPELRRFDFDPVAKVLAARGSYVAAALTIVLAYRTAGEAAVCDPVGSYADWSRMVRAPLIWLGEADPIASMETVREEDPELAAIRELHAHWTDHLGEVSPYSAAAIIQSACARETTDFNGYGYGSAGWKAPEFRDLLLRIAGDGGAVSSRRLGKWLSRISGRIVDARKITMKIDSSNGNRFSLSRADGGGHAHAPHF